MENILNQLNKVRQKLKNYSVDSFLAQKPFALGMYQFSIFMITYYSRVKNKLKMDYDSFMIVQSVVSESLHRLNKKKTQSRSYGVLEQELDNEISKFDKIQKISSYSDSTKYYNKLTMAGIRVITGLPKETVRRKTNELIRKNILRNTKKEGFYLGPAYKKIFQDFVPETTLEVSKLVKGWEKTGALKNLLNFKI